MAVTEFAARAAGALAARIDRRKFLSRTAMVSTALVAAPTDFVLRPTTAYAAVCNCHGTNCDCGSLCCDGYTEFCCTLNGINACPPGTMFGGWWKADGTSFCNGGPRYYLDCNAGCGGCGCGDNGLCGGDCTGTPCGCTFGDCNHRKNGCTVFRYGQCHQDVACLGPIVCRVVTCTPPWVLDGSCSASPRTDDYTGSQDAPCLHDQPIGSLDVVRSEPGGLRVAGWAIDPNTTGPIDVHVYVNGNGFPIGAANQYRPDVGKAYPQFGPNHGFSAFVPWTKAGSTTVCAFGINVGPPAPNAQLGSCKTFDHGGPFGSLDSVEYAYGGLRVRGWAIDPDTADPINVTININGTTFPIGVADGTRWDVAWFNPGYGEKHGFDAVVPWTKNGSLPVYAFGVNQGASHANTSIGNKPFARTGAPFGSLDLVANAHGGIRVAGWVIDPDSRDPVDVHVYVNGSGIPLGPASLQRDDIAAAFPSFGGNHGFDAVIPWDRTGTATVCAYGINVGVTAPNSQLGCKSINANGGA